MAIRNGPGIQRLILVTVTSQLADWRERSPVPGRSVEGRTDRMWRRDCEADELGRGKSGRKAGVGRARGQWTQEAGGTEECMQLP